MASLYFFVYALALLDSLATNWAHSLAPQKADQTIYEGEGGGYYTWSTSGAPFLSQPKLGAGKLVLQPNGFVLPHYTDAKKIGYVLQGRCVVGIISPNSTTEKVVKIEKGDAIPVALGAVSWWYNEDDSDVVIIFLGDTTNSIIPGQISFYFSTIQLGGFSTQFLAKGFGLTASESKALFENQNAPTIITKLKSKMNISEPPNNNRKDLVFNLENVLPFVNIKNGGSLVSATAGNFPLLNDVGLSVYLVKLEPKSMLTPGYTADASYKLCYVSRGSARIQIVGLNGQLVLDDKVEAGQLFVVPKFFSASLIADKEGLELVATLTSSEPILGNLAGYGSVWKALSPSILKASLNLSMEDEDIFKAKIAEATIIIPPNIN
nr:glutelin type-A 3 isoform X1 [Ipomoea batatas]